MARERQLNWRIRILFILLNAFKRLGLALVVMTAVAIPSLLIYNTPPAQYNYNEVTIDYSNPFRPQDHYKPFDPDFNFTVLIDVHSHTDVGGGQISPETSIQWHIANGYNAMVVTDHNMIERAFEAQRIAREKYNDQFKVIVGEEWTNCRMHMGLIGIKELIPIPKDPTDEEIQNVIKATHDQGGIVIVNHVVWSYYAGLNMPSMDDLVKWGVDYFDVTTGQVFDLQTLYYARNHGVGVVAATDIHEIMTANEWTLLNPANFTEEAILEALKSRKTSIIFDFIGHDAPTNRQQPPENKDYIAAIPWLLAGKLFHSFYWRSATGTYSFVDGFCGQDPNKSQWVIDTRAIGVSVAWLVVVWIILEIVFGLIRFGVVKLYNRVTKKNRVYHDDDLTETPLLDLWKK